MEPYPTYPVFSCHIFLKVHVLCGPDSVTEVFEASATFERPTKPRAHMIEGGYKGFFKGRKPAVQRTLHDPKETIHWPFPDI